MEAEQPDLREVVGIVAVLERIIPEKRILEPQVVAVVGADRFGRGIKVLVAADLANGLIHRVLVAVDERTARILGVVDQRISVYVGDLIRKTAHRAVADEVPHGLQRRGPVGVPRHRMGGVSDSRADGEQRGAGVGGILIRVLHESADIQGAVEIGVRDAGQLDRDVPASVGRGRRRAFNVDHAVDGGRLVGVAARRLVGRGRHRLRDDHADLFIVEVADREDDPDIGVVVFFNVQSGQRLIAEVLDLRIRRRNDRQNDRHGDDQQSEEEQRRHSPFGEPNVHDDSPSHRVRSRLILREHLRFSIIQEYDQKSNNKTGGVRQNRHYPQKTGTVLCRLPNGTA